MLGVRLHADIERLLTQYLPAIPGDPPSLTLLATVTGHHSAIAILPTPVVTFSYDPGSLFNHLISTNQGIELGVWSVGLFQCFLDGSRCPSIAVGTNLLLPGMQYQLKLKHLIFSPSKLPLIC